MPLIITNPPPPPPMAGHRTAPEIAKIAKKLAHLVDVNDHSGAVLALVLSFPETRHLGTLARAIRSYHMSKGSLSTVQSMRRAELTEDAAVCLREAYTPEELAPLSFLIKVHSSAKDADDKAF